MMSVKPFPGTIISISLPTSLNQLLFAYYQTDPPIMPQVLFVDYSSAFHTRVPSRLVFEAEALSKTHYTSILVKEASSASSGGSETFRSHSGCSGPLYTYPIERILCRRIVTLTGNCTKKDFLHSSQHSQFLRNDTTQHKPSVRIL